jgi:TolB-like protein
VPLRRHLVVFVLFASALLVAATPKPLGTPVPAPTAAPTLPGTIVPTIVVYPFDAPSDLDPRYGTAVAQIFAQVMSQTGGVKVLAIPNGIQRVDYQKYAHVQHADYYISGYIQPIGQTAAIVTQVVDVNSDISVYSTTTNIADVNDVASQALTARTVVLQAAGVERPEINAGPANTPTPSSTSGASTSLTNVLGDLFHGKKPKATAGPVAAVTPSKPARGVLIVRLTGNAQSNIVNDATGDLYRGMNVYYSAAMSSVATADVAKSADSICGKARDNTIASGTLNVAHVGGVHAHDSYTFTLNVYACFGALLYTNTQTDDNYAKAVLDAVDAYHDDHPENNG